MKKRLRNVAWLCVCVCLFCVEKRGGGERDTEREEDERKLKEEAKKGRRQMVGETPR